MTIYSSRTRINTPGAPKEPGICISYLIASISLQPQKSLSEEGRQPQLLLFRRHFGNNQVAGVSLCQIKTLPPLRWGHSGLVHEGPALGAHQSLTSFSTFCLFSSMLQQTRERKIRHFTETAGVVFWATVTTPEMRRSTWAERALRSALNQVYAILGAPRGLGSCFLEGPFGPFPTYRPKGSSAVIRPAQCRNEKSARAVMAGQNQKSNVPASHLELLFQSQS